MLLDTVLHHLAALPDFSEVPVDATHECVSAVPELARYSELD